MCARYCMLLVLKPGSHKIALEWTQTQGLEDQSPQLRPKKGSLIFSIGLTADDPLQARKIPIPLRKGQVLIWNTFLFHANHPNSSNRWRLCQVSLSLTPSTFACSLPSTVISRLFCQNLTSTQALRLQLLGGSSLDWIPGSNGRQTSVTYVLSTERLW